MAGLVLAIRVFLAAMLSRRGCPGHLARRRASRFNPGMMNFMIAADADDGASHPESFRDAPLGAGLESIRPAVVMDSGLAPSGAPRNDGLIFIGDTSGTGSRCSPVICPSGGLLTGVSSPLCKNISVFTHPKSHLELFMSHPTTGAYRDRHGRGVRMRWTRQRFARDGIAGQVEIPVSDHRASGREMLQRTAKSCGPDAPTLASSSRMLCRPLPGAGKTLIRWRRWQRARSPRRARRKPLKPLRAGMPGDSGVLVVTRVLSTLPSAHEAAGAAGTRHSPRPQKGAKRPCTTRAHRAARSRSHVWNWSRHRHSGAMRSIEPGISRFPADHPGMTVSGLHVIASAAKQSILASARWIASLRSQ
jgi:hypothetical protein